MLAAGRKRRRAARDADGRAQRADAAVAGAGYRAAAGADGQPRPLVCQRGGARAFGDVEEGDREDGITRELPAVAADDSAAEVLGGGARVGSQPQRAARAGGTSPACADAA